MDLGLVLPSWENTLWISLVQGNHMESCIAIPTFVELED